MFTLFTVNSVQSGLLFTLPMRARCEISYTKSIMQQESYCYSLKESVAKRSQFCRLWSISTIGILTNTNFLIVSVIWATLFYKTELLLTVFLYVIYVSALQKLMLHVNILVPSSSHLSQKQSNKEIPLAIIICQLTVVYTTKSWRNEMINEKQQSIIPSPRETNSCQ